MEIVSLAFIIQFRSPEIPSERNSCIKLMNDFQHGQGDNNFVAALEFVFNVRPHLCPLPQGEDFIIHARRNLASRPASPAARISKNAANGSPSPWGAATAAMAGEGGRETNFRTGANNAGVEERGGFGGFGRAALLRRLPFALADQQVSPAGGSFHAGNLFRHAGG
jgi:hypothetical protein